MKKKTLLAVLALALLGSTGCTAYIEDPSWRPPTTEIEISYFYDALTPYGDWLWVEPWGRVWTPWGVEAGWRPYTQGKWAWTSLGWTWVSDEVWGWAPYHYGRWAYDPHHGWLWIPDTVWAPAWVAWRSGNGWIGWAPLPPHARWRAGIGLDLGGVDISLSIVEHGWCFVHDRDFLEPRIWRRLEPLPRHRRLLRDTADRTRYEERDRRVAVRSIPVEEIERNAGPVRRYPVEDLEKPPRGDAGVTRPPRSVEPPERTAARDRRELEEWERDQRQRLEQEQKREVQKPPPDETAAELKRRQEEERHAVRKEAEREKQVQDNRRERQAQQKPVVKEKPAVTEKPAPKKPRVKPPKPEGRR